MRVSNEELEELYRRYGPAVRNRLNSLLSDSEEARDLTQETFMHFAKGNFRGESAPFTYLYSTATFLAVERLRTRARWSGRLARALEEAGDDPELAPPLGSQQVDAAQDLALLTQGMDPRTLNAAMLYFVDGCTTEEVGEALELSRKTVGKLLAQFLERARKRAARLGGEEVRDGR